MKLQMKAGSTSQSINIFIQDSSSTTGGGLTGLVFNTSGLIAYYALPRAASVAITLATLAAVTSAYSSGGFKEIDATHMPGWYRLDIPDAALVAGRFVNLHLQGAANMAPLPIEIELTAVDNQSATAFVSSVPSVVGSVGSVTAAVSTTSNIKRNQALAGFEIVMTDSTTHNPVTGKTVTVTRSLDGGAFSAGTISAVTEIGNGFYKFDLAAADMDGKTVNLLATATGCDALPLSIITTP